MYGFSPSLMCMDLSKFREQIEFMNKVATSYHIDIMDGHFVPNLSLSPWFAGEVKKLSTIPVETHLMVTHPGDYIESCAKAGSDLISLQVETLDGQAFRLLNAIKAKGIKAGLTLNPETSLDRCAYYLDEVQKVTIMTVDPGFAGQPFVPQMIGKIEALRALRDEKGLDFVIQIDGACNKANYKAMASAGGRDFVMGSTGLFKLQPDLERAWEQMEKEFAEETKGIA